MAMPDKITIDAAELEQFVVRVFNAADVPTAASESIAESLVDSNLCGHESHGVVRVTEYVGQLETGSLRPNADFEVVSESASTLVCDAHLGFGQVQMRRLLGQLMSKACEHGSVCGTVRNCGHVGRLGEWCERLARDGFASLLAVNDNGVLKCVAPPGGTEPRISTNPIAIGAPGNPDPVVLDFSTSVVANGKINVARLAGQQVPEGWLLDADGKPTTDPNVRFTDPRGSIEPMGGYKGFGLGLLFDMLIGGLSGGQCPPAPDGSHECNNVMCLVFSPARFSGSDHFLKQAGDLVDFVRESRLREGANTIRLPGDRSQALRRERQANGVPIDAGTWSELLDTARSLGVETEDLPAV